MTHTNKDTLLKSLLQLLDGQEENNVQEHLAICKDCQALYDDLKYQTDLISGLEPNIEVRDYPLPKIYPVIRMKFIRFATAMILGFIAGLITAEYTFSSPIKVVEQHLITKQPEALTIQYNTCEEIDLDSNYY